MSSTSTISFSQWEYACACASGARELIECDVQRGNTNSLTFGGK